MAAYDVTTAGARLQFDTQVSTNTTMGSFMVDTNHFINFWQGVDLDGYVQIFTVNTSTWAITTAAASLEFDTQSGQNNKTVQIDSNHFLAFWRGATDLGYTQVFTVDTTTWAVTTAAARLNFETQQNLGNAPIQVDSNHFLNFFAGESQDGYAQVFTVNTTTWAVTTAAASLEFDTQQGRDTACAQIDTNHFINFWAGGTTDTGYVQVFTVNTTTWAVTTAAASLNFAASILEGNACFKVDTNHFILFYKTGNSGVAQIFEVNTSTWAVTATGSSCTFENTRNFDNACAKVDTNHFINFWSGPDEDGFVRVFTVNTSTWDITVTANVLEFDTVGINSYNSALRVDSTHFVDLWGSTGASSTYAQVFALEVPTTDANFFMVL